MARTILKQKPLYLLLPLLIAVAAGALYFLAIKPALSRSASNALGLNASNSPAAIPAVTAKKKEKPAKITVNGIYLTAYSAGSQTKVDKILVAIKGTTVNAVVIDVKDYTGYLSYDSQLPLVQELGLKQIKIKDLPGLVKKLQDQGLYVIARIAVFQDPALSLKKTDWAVLNKNTGALWRDRKGLSWLDPANPEVWDYHAAIAKEVIAMGFDEVNLDYIRFPSDGQMSAMQFPKWTDARSKAEVIKDFFNHFRTALKDEPAYLSADLFGMTTTAKSDLNIGQVLENAAPYFDYICPMVYPSHYPTGYLKFKNPADHPYEVINKDVGSAVGRLASSTDSIAAIRPWIQDFDLGAVYTAALIKKEIKASEDAGGQGWLAWDPKNIYTWEAYK